MPTTKTKPKTGKATKGTKRTKAGELKADGKTHKATLGTKPKKRNLTSSLEDTLDFLSISKKLVFPYLPVKRISITRQMTDVVGICGETEDVIVKHPFSGKHILISYKLYKRLALKSIANQKTK